MLKTFKYTCREFDSFNEVLKIRNMAGQEYFKFWVDLENKKDKLFLAGEVSKWEIDFKEVKLTPEDVLKNKKVAKVLMLPQQTQCLKQMQKVFGYMNTQMLEQSEFVGLKRAKRYVRALTELCNEHIETYQDVDLQSNFIDFSQFDELKQPDVQCVQESMRCRGQASVEASTAASIRSKAWRRAA